MSTVCYTVKHRHLNAFSRHAQSRVPNVNLHLAWHYAGVISVLPCPGMSSAEAYLALECKHPVAGRISSECVFLANGVVWCVVLGVFRYGKHYLL